MQSRKIILNVCVLCNYFYSKSKLLRRIRFSWLFFAGQKNYHQQKFVTGNFLLCLKYFVDVYWRRSYIECDIQYHNREYGFAVNDSFVINSWIFFLLSVDFNRFVVCDFSVRVSSTSQLKNGMYVESFEPLSNWIWTKRLSGNTETTSNSFRSFEFSKYIIYIKCLFSLIKVNKKNFSSWHYIRMGKPLKQKKITRLE